MLPLVVMFCCYLFVSAPPVPHEMPFKYVRQIDTHLKVAGRETEKVVPHRMTIPSRKPLLPPPTIQEN